MLKTEFPSDHFSSGPSTVACLGEDGLSIELPKQGKVTGNRWRVTPATNRKVYKKALPVVHLFKHACDIVLDCYVHVHALLRNLYLNK